MTMIRYVGSKPIKIDGVAKTGIVWNGNGDIQDVPAEAAAKLLHPDYAGIWQLVENVPETDPDFKGDPDVKYGVLMVTGDKETTIVLDTMDDAQLHVFVTEHKLKVDKRKKGDALREAIVKAATGE